MDRVCILDRSGSMHACRDDTIGGYNAFVEAQKDLGGRMTLYLFDDTVSTIYENRPIKEVEPLTVHTFVPRGSTALYDAIGYAITQTHGKAIFIILTDGHENASTKYSSQAVKDMIHMKEAEGCEFLYLAAHEDAFDDASRIGISRRNAMEFDTHDSPATFHAIDQCVRARSTGVDTPLGNKNRSTV